ncbi:MAG: NAD(P)H-hydrate dehydratase [Duodenibacillus sp.]|nr:NAD(P)H-hydrate dehydratase [Duodenibacillus sp.]
MSQQILNLDELHALEHRYNNLLPEGELMRRAGQAVANTIDTIAQKGQHVVIICGPGNNGGDGFACALALKQLGYRVTCALIGCDKPKTPDALGMFRAWENAGGTTIADPYNADKADVVVDALFGTGLKKALSGDFQDAAMWFNERQAVHISIDVPSGLDAMTGNWVGGIKGCMSDITVAMLAPKAGCYMNVGADAAGQVLVEELDVSVPLSTVGLIEVDDFRHVLEPRDKHSHKGTYGHVVVIGGETGTVGAALLAGRAALKLGAGKVTIEMMSDRAPVVDPLYPELMITTEACDLSQASCLVVGCGLGFSAKAKERLMAAINTPVPLVLDADALRIMAEDLSVQDAVLARKAHTVITPHPGEAAAILRCPVEKVQADRIQAAREIAIQTGAISILKGIGSVVTLRSSRTWINPTGNASLATAGSGDVLAGMIGATFAQDFDLVSSTLSAVWLHGQSAEGYYAGMTASDIIVSAADTLDAMRSGEYDVE